jgi:hypothetical protein
MVLLKQYKRGDVMNMSFKTVAFFLSHQLNRWMLLSLPLRKLAASKATYFL